MRVCRVVVALVAMLVGAANAAFAAKIVIANDEWHTSNTGFSNSPVGATNFALNLATFFTGGGAGSFLVVSDNFSLDLDSATTFHSTLAGAGHTLVDSEDIAGFAFDVSTLQAYDGVLLALPPAVNQGVLIDYVNAGGNVYIHAGTGVGGSAVEAASWNTFLNTFGLNFLPVYNGIGGNVAIASGHPLMAGVPSLYQNNGNSITLVGGNPYAQIIASLGTTGQGLYGVYDNSAVQAPEPSSLLLVGLGALCARRRIARRLR